MKKVLALLLTVCMCFSLVALLASCGSEAKFTFKLSDDGSYYIITAINITESTEVLDVPAEYEGKPVKAMTSLDEWTPLIQVKNNNESKLTAVNIPNSIRFIDGLYVNEGCAVNFGDYAGNLVPTSTLQVPEGSNYSNMQSYTFYEFSLILTDCNLYAKSGSIQFPENVVLFHTNNSTNSVAFDTVSFKGMVSPYQKGDASNGWDNVTITFFGDFQQCKTVQVPEVAVGAGYYDISVIVAGSDRSEDLNTENLILSKSINKLRFISSGVPTHNVNMYWEEVCEPTITFSDNITRSMQEELFKVYLYSETAPADTEMQYWHYVNGVPTAW